MALDCGMMPNEFWEYSVAEIYDYIESYERIKKQKTKEMISFGYMLSSLIIDLHFLVSSLLHIIFYLRKSILHINVSICTILSLGFAGF